MTENPSTENTQSGVVCSAEDIEKRIRSARIKGAGWAAVSPVLVATGLLGTTTIPGAVVAFMGINALVKSMVENQKLKQAQTDLGAWRDQRKRELNSPVLSKSEVVKQKTPRPR